MTRAELPSSGRNPRSIRRILGVAALLAALCTGPFAEAAGPEWLKLVAPRFGLISQLDEDDTRKWAVEFDQFVDAQQQFLSVENLDLPPLTIVLFKNARRFAPYRNRTESGQADVAGFFADMGTWSTIGLGGRSTAVTRIIVYHEATHWILSASDTANPMWFEEGLATAFSTFEVKNGKGYWGAPLEGYVAYLNTRGLEPMDQFFRLSQDEALHGSSAYYPQAWAFIHYLIFGDAGAQRGRLATFLQRQRETSLNTAFADAFGQSYDEFGRALRDYLDDGRYAVGMLDVQDHGGDMVIEPASAANVEISLARLAASGGNLDLAERHANALIDLVPTSPAGYEVLAFVAAARADAPAQRAALDKAIELGSVDAAMYSSKAYALLQEHEREGAPLAGFLPPEQARTAADLFVQSIALQPRHRIAYQGLALALLSVDGVTAEHVRALEIGRRVFPTEGLVAVAEAAVARTNGNPAEAVQRLRQSRAAPFTIPLRYRSAIGALHDGWLIEWLRSQVAELARDGRFDEAFAMIDEQIADPLVENRTRSTLRSLRTVTTELERIHAAVAAARDGDLDEARRILTELVDSEATTSLGRRQARRFLSELPAR